MKKLEFKPLMISISLVLFQTFCFFISKLLEAPPHLIGGAIDKMIPFNIWFIIPYISWYILIFLIPYFLYLKDKDLLKRYIYSYILCTLIASIIFIIYPTTVLRPEVEATNILTFAAKTVFWFDTPILNCFPSLHCAMSLLFITFIIEVKDVNRVIKTIIIFISILIMASTLFVKQHVFIDLVSGDLIALVVYYLIKIIYNKSDFLKKLLKL